MCIRDRRVGPVGDGVAGLPVRDTLRGGGGDNAGGAGGGGLGSHSGVGEGVGGGTGVITVAATAGTSTIPPASPVFSVWDRNIQLALYSIGIYLPIAWFETNGNVLDGWTPLVWGIACLHASGGILVALAVLYTSSITKTVAVCASLVLTTVMGYVFFEAPLNGPILLGCFVVVLTVFGYRDDCDVDDELGRLRLAASQSQGQSQGQSL